MHGFASEGARVLLVDIDGEQADRVRAEALDLGAAEVRVLETDLSVEGSGGLVARSAVDAWGGVDTLVNNAGWSGIYGTTKAGMIALARTTAHEYRREGVRSNVVCPGLVLPDEGGVGAHSLWSAGRDAIFDDDQIDYVRRRTPLRRLTTPRDIGDAVVWFSSEITARQVTGQVIAVGGGSTMP